MLKETKAYKDLGSDQFEPRKLTIPKSKWYITTGKIMVWIMIKQRSSMLITASINDKRSQTKKVRLGHADDRDWSIRKNIDSRQSTHGRWIDRRAIRRRSIPDNRCTEDQRMEDHSVQNDSRQTMHGTPMDGRAIRRRSIDRHSVIVAKSFLKKSCRDNLSTCCSKHLSNDQEQEICRSVHQRHTHIKNKSDYKSN